MDTIRFFLLGKFRVEVATRPIQKFEPYKAKELLVYLLLHRDQPQSREHLAELLWGEITPEQSKSYLRKALWQLQSIVEPYGGEELLNIDNEWLQINPSFEFWLDLEVLENTFKHTKGIAGNALEENQSKSLHDAIELYRGDLLEGWYQDWCLYERGRLQYLYLAMLDKLMARCEAQEDYESGLMYGEKILQYDRARERTHRRLMRMHYKAGDRTSALRQYQKCAQILHEELDVEPAGSTQELYEKLRKDSLEEPHPLETGMGVPLEAVMKHLRSFHQQLNQIQGRLAEDIETIHREIKGKA